MGRLIFFIQEAFRALRRNAAPSMAAVVTTVVTVILLGVLIPIFQTTQAKSDEIRDQLELRVDDLRRRDQSRVSDRCARSWRRSPHVQSLEFVSKREALVEVKEILDTDENPAAVLSSNPLPAAFAVRPDDPANLDSIRQAITPPGPAGAPQPISPVIQEVFDRRQERQKIEQVTGAVKIVLTVVTALLDRRLADAGRQHDPPLDLHPPPGGRGDAAGRRHPLVHPLAVHDRGSRRRVRGRRCRHTDSVARQGHDRRPVVRHASRSSRRRTRRPCRSRCWSGSSSGPRSWSPRSAPGSRCAASSRFDLRRDRSASRHGGGAPGRALRRYLARRPSRQPAGAAARRLRRRRGKPQRRGDRGDRGELLPLDRQQAALATPRSTAWSGRCAAVTRTASRHYFDPQDLERFRESISGRFSGVGLSVSEVEAGLRVGRVFPGAPAEEAGIAVGDVIVSVERALDRRRGLRGRDRKDQGAARHRGDGRSSQATRRQDPLRDPDPGRDRGSADDQPHPRQWTAARSATWRCSASPRAPTRPCERRSSESATAAPRGWSSTCAATEAGCSRRRF